MAAIESMFILYNSLMLLGIMTYIGLALHPSIIFKVFVNFYKLIWHWEGEKQKRGIFLSSGLHLRNPQYPGPGQGEAWSLELYPSPM